MREIRDNSFTVGINHSFAIEHMHPGMMFDALIWQDWNVTKDLMLWVRNKLNKKGKKIPILWSREVAFSYERRGHRPDPENTKLLRDHTVFIPKTRKSGSYTAGLALEYLRNEYPDKTILIFGLDHRGTHCWYDRYFEPIKKIKKCWDVAYTDPTPNDPYTGKPVKFVRKAKEDLNVWINDPHIFNMSKNSNYTGLKKMTTEELWHKNQYRA